MAALGRAKTILETLSTVMVVAAASGLLWTLFFKQPPTAFAGVPPITDVKEVLSAEHLTNAWGSGPIAIVEFSDFQCPFCAKHAEETVPVLRKEFGPDKVRYVVLNLPLDIHPQAVPAAEAAECAGAQGKFWEMHELLFAKQKELPTADYQSYASGLGLDVLRFNICLEEHETMPKVRADQQEAARLKTAGTPTLFVGRMRSDGGVDLVKRIGGAASAPVLIDEVRVLQRK